MLKKWHNNRKLYTIELSTLHAKNTFIPMHVHTNHYNIWCRWVHIGFQQVAFQIKWTIFILSYQHHFQDSKRLIVQSPAITRSNVTLRERSATSAVETKRRCKCGSCKWKHWHYAPQLCRQSWKERRRRSRTGSNACIVVPQRIPAGRGAGRRRGRERGSGRRWWWCMSSTTATTPRSSHWVWAWVWMKCWSHGPRQCSSVTERH